MKYQIQNELEISNNSLSIIECVREPDSLLWNIERIVRKSTLFEYYFSKIIHLEKCIDIIKFHIITAPSFSPCMSQTLSSEFSNSIVLELYNWPRTLLSSNFIDLELYWPRTLLSSESSNSMMNVVILNFSQNPIKKQIKITGF